MKRRLVLSFLATALVLVLAACSSKSEYKFGTGGTGGTYFAFGNTLSEMMKEENSDISFEIRNTAGSAANLRLISEGFLQLALTQSDTLKEADSKYRSGYGVLTALYTEACQIVVPADSSVTKITDLAGLKIGVGEEESGVLNNSRRILQACGISFEMIEPAYLSFTDSAKALKAGDIDAFFCTAGAPTNAISDLAAEMAIRLLPLEDAICDNMINLYGSYTKCTVPAGTYPGQDGDIATIGVKAVLLAGSSMKAEDAEAITGFIVKNREEICRRINVTYESDPAFVYEDIPAAFHEGAVNFFKSEGIAVESADASGTGKVTGGQDN